MKIIYKSLDDFLDWSSIRINTWTINQCITIFTKGTKSFEISIGIVMCKLAIIDFCKQSMKIESKDGGKKDHCSHDNDNDGDNNSYLC